MPKACFLQKTSTDHNPPMDYPGSMSENVVYCLDTAPIASD